MRDEDKSAMQAADPHLVLVVKDACSVAATMEKEEFRQSLYGITPSMRYLNRRGNDVASAGVTTTL